MPAVRLSRIALLAFAAANAACGGEATSTGGTGTPTPSGGAGGTNAGGRSGSGGVGGALGDGGFINAPPYGIPPGSGGTLGNGGAGGALGDGGMVSEPPYGAPFPPDAGPVLGCKDLFGGGQPSRCCPETKPDCSTKPDGWPGYTCTPPPESFCACQCQSGQWVCAC
jgi:hypothetical protein